MAKAKFVVRRASGGRFRFDLIGPNGRVLSSSRTYESRASALRGVASVRKHAGRAELVDRSGARVVGAVRMREAPKRTRVPVTIDPDTRLEPGTVVATPRREAS